MLFRMEPSKSMVFCLIWYKFKGIRAQNIFFLSASLCFEDSFVGHLGFLGCWCPGMADKVDRVEDSRSSTMARKFEEGKEGKKERKNGRTDGRTKERMMEGKNCSLLHPCDYYMNVQYGLSAHTLVLQGKCGQGLC